MAEKPQKLATIVIADIESFGEFMLLISTEEKLYLDFVKDFLTKAYEIFMKLEAYDISQQGDQVVAVFQGPGDDIEKENRDCLVDALTAVEKLKDIEPELSETFNEIFKAHANKTISDLEKHKDKTFVLTEEINKIIEQAKKLRDTDHHVSLRIGVHTGNPVEKIAIEGRPEESQGTIMWIGSRVQMAAKENKDTKIAISQQTYDFLQEKKKEIEDPLKKDREYISMPVDIKEQKQFVVYYLMNQPQEPAAPETQRVEEEPDAGEHAPPVNNNASEVEKTVEPLPSPQGGKRAVEKLGADKRLPAAKNNLPEVKITIESSPLEKGQNFDVNKLIRIVVYLLPAIIAGIFIFINFSPNRLLDNSDPDTPIKVTVVDQKQPQTGAQETDQDETPPPPPPSLGQVTYRDRPEFFALQFTWASYSGPSDNCIGYFVEKDGEVIESLIPSNTCSSNSCSWQDTEIYEHQGIHTYRFLAMSSDKNVLGATEPIEVTYP